MNQIDHFFAYPNKQISCPEIKIAVNPDQPILSDRRIKSTHVPGHPKVSEYPDNQDREREYSIHNYSISFRAHSSLFTIFRLEVPLFWGNYSFSDRLENPRRSRPAPVKGSVPAIYYFDSKSRCKAFTGGCYPPLIPLGRLFHY